MRLPYTPVNHTAREAASRATATGALKGCGSGHSADSSVSFAGMEVPTVLVDAISDVMVLVVLPAVHVCGTGTVVSGVRWSKPPTKRHQGLPRTTGRKTRGQALSTSPRIASLPIPSGSHLSSSATRQWP
jgi:hypothetical protein